MEKKVVPTLDPLLLNPKLEPELLNAIKDNLICLLHRNKFEGSGCDPATPNNVNNGNNNENAHSGNTFTANLPESPPGGKEPPDSLHLNFSMNISGNHSGILSPDIGSAAVQSFPPPMSPLETSTLSPVSKGLASLVPKNNSNFEPATIKFEADEPILQFSEDEDDDDIQAASPQKPTNGMRDRS